MLRISILDQMNTRAQCIHDDGNALRGPEAYETVKDASRIRMSDNFPRTSTIILILRLDKVNASQELMLNL